MDADKLQEALDYGSANAGFAVRVYRRGCLVGADRAEGVNDNTTFESYSMSKSIASILFGRAMTLGLISPDDPVGSLVPEADQAHGEITMLDLLTMSSGLLWNGFRDYNVFTMPDRVRDALTLPVVHEPGTYFEYAQSAVALLVKAVERAVGEDPQQFLQREVLDHIGIDSESWTWARDRAGNIQGFWGATMRADDFGRLGELLRRGGVWRGQRLLSRNYVRRATSPSETNGCYGWLIWVNAGAPCVGVTIEDRGVSQERMYPTIPADMYNFSGLFGQLVTVFPSQELVIVRTGQDPGMAGSYGESWELGLYRRVLESITDEPIKISPPAKPTRDEPDTDYGFQTAIFEPDQYSQGGNPDPLPPAGPGRARAARLRLAGVRRQGSLLRVRLSCPRRWPGEGVSRCVGVAVLGGGQRARTYAKKRYSVRAGRSRTLVFKLSRQAQTRLRNPRSGGLAVTATNSDQAGGTSTTLVVKRRRSR